MSTDPIQRFDKNDYYTFCNLLAAKDNHLRYIKETYGYPPFWVRPNTFATLILTILEQQVSINAAYAAYQKLKEKLPVLSPQNFLQLTDDELRACYFSRQKIGYARTLASAICSRQLSLRRLSGQPDDAVRTELKKLKGIGDWTADIYLLHALRRSDIFPVGDLALMNALKEIKDLSLLVSKEQALHIAEPWKPYRSIATMMLWHYYIQKRKIRLSF